MGGLREEAFTFFFVFFSDVLFSDFEDFVNFKGTGG
jgi:hypothetical protein